MLKTGLPLPPQKNHLAGIKRQLLKVSFYNVQHLMDVRRDLVKVIRRNKVSPFCIDPWGSDGCAKCPMSRGNRTERIVSCVRLFG